MTKSLLISIIILLSVSCNKKDEELTYISVQMKDIPYGPHIKQKLDISLPNNADKNNNVPIALFIHGGSWISGDKNDFDWIKETVNNYNFAYITINYRLLQDNVTYKQMLEDITLSIEYLKNNSEKYYLKPDKIFIMGSSAGGHLALLYSYSINSPIKIACVSSQTGPTDFSDPDQISLNGKENLVILNNLLGTQITIQQLNDPDFSFPIALKMASPIYHISDDTPPTILAYGEKDNLVSYSNALRLKDKLEEHRIDHKLINYPNSGHDLNNDPDKSQEYWETLTYFIAKYMTGK